MNYLCILCSKPASHACVHPKCQFFPFTCNGGCSSYLSQTMHNHDHKMLIPMTDYYNNIEEIKSKIDIEESQKEYFDNLRKKVTIIKEHLTVYINKIQKHVQSYIEDVKNYLKLNLNPQFKKIINMLDESKNGGNVRGKQISKLMQIQKVFIRQTLPAFEAMKLQYDTKLSKLQTFDIFKDFKFCKQRKQKSQMLKQQCQLIWKQQKYQLVLKLMQQSKYLFDFDHQTYFKLGFFYELQKKLSQSKQCYHQCLKLKQNHQNSLNNLALIYSDQQNYNKALQLLTKAIDLNNKQSLYYKNRADVYKKMKQYQLASDDYYSANKLDINKQHQCVAQIKKIANLIK